MTNSRIRSLLAAVALSCIALLGYAYFLQYGSERQQPCPLCVLQRYAYFVIGVIAAIGAMWPRRGIIFVGVMVSLIGTSLALWQVLKGADMTSCQRDPIGIFVNGLPMADWWPAYLFASGGCADRYVTLGLPVPLWSLICFIALLAVFVGVGWYLRKRPNSAPFA